MKIIKILDKYTYIIDGGMFDGIKKGQKCYIYLIGEEISDPSTGKILGSLEVPKTYCSVTHVQDNISIIQSDDAPSPMLGFSSFAIKLNYDYFDQMLTTDMKKIKIGDNVKMVIG
jgi:hypothetical protein